MTTPSPAGLGGALAEVSARLGDRVRRHVPLAPLTTYRVGGAAALLTRVESDDDLSAVVAAVSGVGGAGVPLLVVGRGSNLLVADEGFAGLAIVLGERFATISADGDQVTAGAATALPVLARRTAAMALTGLEWAVGVPGSVGGAVRMNAGGHGSDIAATLIEATVIDLGTGAVTTMPAGSLGLRFRGSDLDDHQLVVRARFQLAAGDRARSEAELAEIVRWRREHQPGGQNAGSVFVNPVPGVLAAAQLIDGLGLRGFRIGTAEVSTKHANFIQADDGGRAADVRAVIEHVRAAVLEHEGIALRSEVRLVGFADTMAASGVGSDD